ncbi:MAG: DUF1592 domain-containing protein [Archangiaceae bacterium]|nr:DUF1592 domain-containing protein [Archangiaceae bacterium]
MISQRATRRLMIALLGATVSGCDGVIALPRPDGPGQTVGVGPHDPGTPPGGTGGGTADPVTPPVVDKCKDLVVGGKAPLRRLTRAEYDHTVRDLLKETAVPSQGFLQDGRLGLFANNAGAPISDLSLHQYFDAAEALATAATTSTRLTALLPCTPSSGEAACARKLIEQLAPRAYRRPLSSAELDGLFAIYSTARTDRARTFAQGLALVIEALLISPHFLNHIEQGDPTRLSPDGKSVALTGYEIASRLSYFLWNTMPDDALLAAAGLGQLDTPEGIATQARRMVALTAVSHPAQLDFYRQWLELNKLPELEKNTALYPAYTPALRTEMGQESDAFISEVLWKDDAKLSTLLTAKYTFVGSGLAKLYGLPAVTGTALQKVPLDGIKRGGLLTHASMLALRAHADQTSPVHRGLLIRERFLCTEMPPPPPDVMAAPPTPSPGMTTRERYAAHSSDPYCRSCHMLMDPIGLGFEHFDPIGAWRDTENGKPIDATGAINSAGEVTGTFDGAIALEQKLASSSRVQSCVTEQSLAYAVGHPIAGDESCSVQSLAKTFGDTGGDLNALLVSVVQSDAFRYRTLPTAPGACP